ncbi:MAG: VIT1/CCC1 transporter family protein [Gammaproteobacteria bacterium]|nr:VIT1/CCC1 transporter family protein [Gammaproteobacteria bacterium]
MEVSKELMKQAIKSQKDEINGYAIYKFMSKRQAKKYKENSEILKKMSDDEYKHYLMWKSITKKDFKAHVFFLKIITVLLGFTFVVKSMSKGEKLGQKNYELLQKELPMVAKMLDDERRHEKELYAMLDEERLHYVGDMVLGLNDALVELTGAITGVCFSIQDPRYIALTGIVTGVSATLSMMASNYLSQKADGSAHPFKSSLYTGIAYLATVFLLVLPYVIFIIVPNPLGYLYAFFIMIATVIIEILAFNYYISVAREEPFFKHFILMVSISLGVAAISYGIGLLANKFLGIEV